MSVTSVVAVESDRGEHSEGSLCHYRPGAPQPDGRELHRTHDHVWGRAEEGEHHRKEKEGDLDHGAAGHHTARHAGDGENGDRNGGVEAEGPYRTGRSCHHGDHEHQERRHLALRRKPVNRALPMDIEGVSVACRHHRSRLPRDMLRAVRETGRVSTGQPD